MAEGRNGQHPGRAQCFEMDRGGPEIGSSETRRNGYLFRSRSSGGDKNIEPLERMMKNSALLWRKWKFSLKTMTMMKLSFP